MGRLGRTINIMAAALAACGAMAGCSSGPAQKPGKELRPLGYFVADELPGSDAGPWTPKTDGQRFMVVVMGVPAAWMKTAEDTGKGSTSKPSEDADPDRIFGYSPSSFALAFDDGRVELGALAADFSAEPRSFSGGLRARYLAKSDGDPIEFMIGVAWALPPKDCQPPCRVRFLDQGEVAVPAKRYEHPAVLQEVFRDSYQAGKK